MLSLDQIIGLNLQKNNMSGPIPDAFRVNCSLTTLDLNGNKLSSRFPKSLANCSALEDLDLGNNQILDIFPSLLKDVSTLRVLILRSNRFYGHITCIKSIGTWPLIQTVDVASNNFRGELPGQCLTKWHTMMTVKGYNQSALPPTASDYKDAVSDIASGPSPYEDAVSVTNNGFEMELVKIVQYGFTSIDFSSNKFHGEIPLEFGQLRALIALNLSNNVLRGQIPLSFDNLLQLESLDLSRNQLSGKIPASL